MFAGSSSARKVNKFLRFWWVLNRFRNWLHSGGSVSSTLFRSGTQNRWSAVESKSVIYRLFDLTSVEKLLYGFERFLPVAAHVLCKRRLARELLLPQRPLTKRL